MRKYRTKSILGLFCLCVTLLTGCVAMPVVVEEPPWYEQPSGARYTVEGSVFYGVGSAEGARSLTLLRATAANRAREEMAHVLDGYAAELCQVSGAMSALPMEDGEQLIGALVRNAMQRTVISDHWYDGRNNRIYALCRLDLETFKEVLASLEGIPPDLRDTMYAEADNLFRQSIPDKSWPR